jgi:hypothetical protein
MGQPNCTKKCVDHRRVNSVFPIPQVHDCLDAVAGAVLFSTMDITVAYNQILVRTEDIPKAFCCQFGLMEFVTMPFERNSDTAIFQRTMEIGLCRLQWTTCVIYLDDVIFFLAGHLGNI